MANITIEFPEIKTGEYLDKDGMIIANVISSGETIVWSGKFDGPLFRTDKLTFLEYLYGTKLVTAKIILPENIILRK